MANRAVNPLFGKYLFFDLETNGFQGEIIQFGWLVVKCDESGARVVSEAEWIVKQTENFTLDYRSFQIHNISMQKIQSQGKSSIEESLKSFINTAKTCQFIAGFNIARFDLHRIYHNCQNYPQLKYFTKDYVPNNWKLCHLLYIVRRYLKKTINYQQSCSLSIVYPMIVRNSKIDATKCHTALYDAKMAFEIFKVIFESDYASLIFEKMYKTKSKLSCEELSQLTNNSSNDSETSEMSECKSMETDSASDTIAVCMDTIVMESKAKLDPQQPNDTKSITVGAIRHTLRSKLTWLESECDGFRTVEQRTIAKSLINDTKKELQLYSQENLNRMQSCVIEMDIVFDSR